MNAKDMNDLITRLLHIALAGALGYLVAVILVFVLFIFFGPKFMNWMMRRMDG